MSTNLLGEVTILAAQNGWKVTMALGDPHCMYLRRGLRFVAVAFSGHYAEVAEVRTWTKGKPVQDVRPSIQAVTDLLQEDS